MRIVAVCTALACSCLIFTSHAARAQNAAAGYPGKPVRLVVPFAPGATSDIIARLLGQKLAEALGQQFITDNRPGAGGGVGAETVVESLKVADYVYFISDGVVAALGTVAEVNGSKDPFVRQFVDSLHDGPAAFHYPGPDYIQDLQPGTR